MPTPQKNLVSLEATPCYYCVSRCVRRAFLCGEDAVSGKSFEHRRQWIKDQLLEIASAFAIDIAAYAVMSNHYHLVLHVDTDRAERWSFEEVIDHRHQLFKSGVLSQRYLAGESLDSAEREILSVQVEQWRGF